MAGGQTNGQCDLDGGCRVDDDNAPVGSFRSRMTVVISARARGGWSLTPLREAVTFRWCQRSERVRARRPC
jgi:hypothetical protein